MNWLYQWHQEVTRESTGTYAGAMLRNAGVDDEYGEERRCYGRMVVTMRAICLTCDRSWLAIHCA